MKTNFNKVLIAAFAIMLFAFSSCKKDFLDVNEDPNNPEDIDMQFLLPSAQANLGYTMGNHFLILGGIWSQYWTQGPNASQYIEFDQYSYNATEANYPWASLYPGALKDLDILYKKAAADSNVNYMAVARIMQAYVLQVITDAWGDVPYKEALRGDEGITSPKYDPQDSIYDALIPLVDEGIALLANADDGPQADDLIFQGDPFLWYKFANTLKLKIYLRQVYKRPEVTATGIAAMPADEAEYLQSGEDAVIQYIDEKFRQHPLYTSIEVGLSGVRNIFASNTSVKYLDNIGDIRLYDFYDPNASGLIAGMNQGSGKNSPPNADDTKISQYNSEEIIAPAVPVRLISASESMFLQAEAIARGYMAGNAQTMYEQGIEDSWNQWLYSSEAMADSTFIFYLAGPQVAYPSGGSLEDQLKAIITQKWIAMNGNQNFESWTEWRRTGYPDFFIESESTVIPGQFPARLLYPTDELTTNPNVILVPNRGLTDKMWWDAN